MDPSSALLIWIVVMLMLSAFFSGIEIAFVSADKLQLELNAKRIPIAGRVLSYFIKSPTHFMGITLVGNTAALVLFGMFMTQFLQPFMIQWFPVFMESEFNFFIVQTLVSTIIVLIFAEFLPKSIFLINPNLMIAVLAFPLMFFYWILYLPMIVIISLTRLTFSLFGSKYQEDQPVFGLTDLNNYLQNLINVEDHEDVKIEVDTKILTNALEFKTVKLRDCMVPRTEISAIDIEDGIEELVRTFTESGHSKIMIYRETIDDIVGYCHAQEMFKKPKDVESITAPIMIVPETMMANELMIQFITERKSVALVVDEYGGTSGIVSMEDIIEEIFGEIQDEHDDDEFIEQKLNEYSYKLSARIEIDYLNDKYGWSLPQGEYETLGGLVLSITEDLPNEEQSITLDDYILTIKEIHDTRIETIKLTLRNNS